MPNSECLDLGGTLRARTASETLDWIRPRLQQFGITRVADITGLDCIGVPVFVSIRPNAKNLAVAQGKGRTKELAQLSAIMESIEDFHSENPLPPDLIGSYRELSSSFLLLPLHTLAPGYFPNAVDEDEPIAWARTRELIAGEETYIPHACICLDTTAVRPEYCAFAISSTGLASGNTTAEALCHAVLEVIERDAHACWLSLPAERRQETEVDLNTVSGPCAQLLECFAASEVEVRVWDMTSPIAVPAFCCAIRDQNSYRTLGAFSGYGAHLSSDIALCRAVTEAAQSRLTLISGSRDDVFPSVYRAQQLDPRPQPALAGQTLRRRAFTPRARLPLSFDEMLNELVARLREQGHHRILVFNHERPCWGVPVVHAFVPGLRDLPL